METVFDTLRSILLPGVVAGGLLGMVFGLIALVAVRRGELKAIAECRACLKKALSAAIKLDCVDAFLGEVLATADVGNAGVWPVEARRRAEVLRHGLEEEVIRARRMARDVASGKAKLTGLGAEEYPQDMVQVAAKEAAIDAERGVRPYVLMLETVAADKPDDRASALLGLTQVQARNRFAKSVVLTFLRSNVLGEVLNSLLALARLGYEELGPEEGEVRALSRSANRRIASVARSVLKQKGAKRARLPEARELIYAT